jgi:hypothetical protein
MSPGHSGENRNLIPIVDRAVGSVQGSNLILIDEDVNVPFDLTIFVADVILHAGVPGLEIVDYCNDACPGYTYLGLALGKAP